MKKKNLTPLTLILLLAALLSSQILRADSAPTLLIGKEAMARLQKNVASGEEPFASAWAKVKESAAEAMSTDMKVYQGVDTVELRFASQKQAGYVRDLMLVYFVEGNVRLRERAVDLFSEWATADPMPGKSHVSLSMQDQKVAGSGLEGLGLNFGLAGLYWANAYSLVYPWLNDSERELTAKWFEYMAEEILRGHLDWTENGYHGNQDYNNHLTGHMLGLLAIGLTLDSQKWIDYALDSEANPRDFYEMYDAAIIMADEDPSEALWRSDPTLAKGAPKPQTGEVYDRYRILTVRDGKGCGLPYAWFHRRMLTLMAEMGHQNGLPLYDYIGKNGENLKDTYVFYSDFLIQNDPSIKGGYYANNKLHLNEVYTYELANLRFPNTPEIIEVLQHCDRVQYDHDVFGWSAVLLYGEVIDSVAAAKADTEQATDWDWRIDSAAVANADFEKGTGWDQRKAHQTFTPDGAVAARSGNAVALTGGWLKRAGEFVYQRTDVPVKPGASYELRAWFAPRSEGQSRYGGAWMRLSAVQPNGTHCVLAHFTSDVAISDWTQYAVAWTAPADLSRVPVLHDSKNEPTGATMDLRGAKLEILVGKYPDRGDSYDQTMIDDVELVAKAGVAKAGVPSARVSQINSDRQVSAEVANANFEKGAGWDQRKAHQTFTPDGAVSARSGNAVALTGGWLKRAGEFVYQRTEVPVKPSASYELRAWFAPRSEGQSRYGGAWMRLSAVQPNGSHCVLAHFTSDAAISDWTQYAVAWTAPADLSRVPVMHASKNEPTGATMDLRGAKLEILVGKYPDRGDSYDQTMIDDVELITTAVVPVTVKPQMDRALQTLELSDGPEKNLDALNVVWETPGRHALDSMPLGNGETALNVWTEADGQIAFYIARGDAWSGIGRLLKLGRMRVRIEPNPFQSPGDFKQTLDLASGTVHVVGSNGFQARIWVDAHQSVIRFEAMADQPFTMTAVNDPWRLEDRQLTKEEQHSAWNVMGGPAKFQVVEADTMLPAAGNRIGWYHRNKISIYPEIMQQQDLVDHMADFPDPLINRTFGALAWGDALVAKDDRTLVTQEPVRQLRLNVTTHTAQTATVEEWVAQAEVQVAAIERRNPITAFTAHSEWWQAFWERSWIYATGPTPDFLVGDALPKTARAQIKIGGDWPGGNLFSGKIAQALFYNKVLSNEEVQQIAAASQDASTEALFEPKHLWNFGALTGTKVPDAGFKQVALDVLGEVSTVQSEQGPAVQLSGKGHFLTEKPSSRRPVGDLRLGGTLAAWIAPDAMPAGGRIFDFTLPGLDGGYLLEVTKGGTGLRGFYNELVTVAENVLTPGEWSQVAMVYDQFHGRLKLFIDGRQVAQSDLIDQHRQSGVAAGIYPITQGYALQRFISACAARGEFPIKFNGSLFTMDGTIDYLWTPNTVDADFRKWGPGYWFQNTRLPYWPMLAAGDFDMMEPLWKMYLDTLDRAKLRTKTYFGHEGAYWSETISFFGMNSLNDYGWSRPGLEPGITRNGPIRRYWDGALELSTMMLDRYDMTLDATFLQEKILPIAGAVITFYEQHYDRDAEGEIRFQPSQTVESYVGLDLYNPVTVVAGMRSVISRLLKLPKELTTAAQRAQWQRVLSELPEIPVADGMLQIAANRQRHFERGNGESPDLYPAFPYHLYGVGRPDLEVARKTFNTLQTWYVGGWNQDSVNAAVLGLPEKAGPLVYRSFLMGSKDAAFPAFWGPNYDWLPDQDHGATAMNALQRMLMQSVDGKILLLPAWPQEWDVDFKLHAPGNTVVRCVYRNGEIETLEVTPAERAADVIKPSTSPTGFTISDM